MPCFKGLAVSIHAGNAPLSEYSIQKQARHSRITSYIPVPPPKVPSNSVTKKPEQSTFAISITLLTPGLDVPYSTPKPTPEEPNPRPKTVAYDGYLDKHSDRPAPYIPLSASANETIAAYIYFDGRAKEEVATLLRRGEETWVNSRWVSVPDSEGGGLAEREFLFREVGLERWLNGLDLVGKDAAATTARRKEKFEKRRRRKSQADLEGYKSTEGVEMDSTGQDSILFVDSDESEPPEPEAAGQIKVALFRVFASGEIKKGEYSPQFDAHDNDDDVDTQMNGESNGNSKDADQANVDHTTSFAKPKSLDPSTISTQTVTGIDGPDKPYAVFTFLYRGSRQLKKMGILQSDSEDEPTPVKEKRRSLKTDFSKLGPIKAGGAVGFSTFRDHTTEKMAKKKPGKKSDANGAAKDSDDEDDERSDEDTIDKDEKVEPSASEKDAKGLLSPEDVERQGELADGVRKIKLKRAHSAEFPDEGQSTSSNPSTIGHSPSSSQRPRTTPPASQGQASQSNSPKLPSLEETTIGSPLKKQRASLSGVDDETARSRLGQSMTPGIGDVLGQIEDAEKSRTSTEPTANVETSTTTPTTTTTTTTKSDPIVEEEEKGQGKMEEEL